MQRPRIIACITATLLLAAPPLAAEQYKSEVHTAPVQGATPKGAEEQLKAAENNPYGKAIIFQQLANDAIGRKDYKQAMAFIDQALAQKALSEFAAGQLRYTLAQLQMSDGQYQKAITGLEAHIKSAESGGGKASADAYIALGSAYAGLKRYGEALPQIQKAIGMSKAPPQEWLQLQLAVQCSSKGGGGCAEGMEQLVRQRPGDKDAWLRLSALYLGLGNPARALAAMELAYRQGLLTQQAELLQLAKLYIAAGNPYQGAALLQRWMQGGQIEKSAGNWELQAAAWQLAREPEQAIAALTQSAQASGRAESWLQLGQLQLERQDWAAAITALGQAQQKGLKQGQGRAALALGYAYQQAGQAAQAEQAFTAASRFADAQAAAKQWLAYLDPEAQAAGAAAPQLDLSTPAPVIEAPNVAPLVNTAPAAAPVSSGPAPTDPVLPKTGDDLTPVGAERAGNADGSIPAWDGGLMPSRWPAAYRKGQHLADPFPTERPLYVITGANAEQYRDKLTAAHMTLLKRYPGYKIPVYATHRTASYPQAIYDATLANQDRAKLSGSDSLQNAKLGFPFRRPKSGVEIMWNHRVRYRGDTVEARSTQAVVAPSGKITSRLFQNERVYFRYGNIKDPVDIGRDNILLYYLAQYDDPGSNNFTVLAHETADSVKDPRAIWVVPPGLRRMFRIPPVGYDQPFLGSEAISFVDMIDMYNGAFDRYVWRLVGKREFIIPYNGYRISDGSYKYSQLLTPKHFNQDATRYELHRVWVIEASERTGKRHVFGNRVFYVDEDSWTVVMVDNHDREGKPWRFQEGHLVNRYDIQSAFCQPVLTYDLRDGRYLASGLRAEEPPVRFDIPMKKGDFTPAVVASRYVR